VDLSALTQQKGPSYVERHDTLPASTWTLPLKPSEDVYVAGSNADNIGNQAGGWTLTWQGGSTNVIPGQTVLDGIKARASHVTFSRDAAAPVPAGANGIVVVGETPYAEGFGDVGGPQWGYHPGKLSVSWPRTVAQEPINVGDPGYDPLYRYGFGPRTP
jgi:hypothetical protein